MSTSWARLDSNQRPTGYEPAALPLSYEPTIGETLLLNYIQSMVEVQNKLRDYLIIVGDELRVVSLQ